MNVLDLFSGIGGFSLGLERAGMRTVAFCEIDPFCRRVLAKHWPSVPCYDDVRILTAASLRADGISVDVICGGFPCQDISFAGAGAGLAGARSGLWSEYARIVGELRPRYVIVENVAALLGRGLDVVLGDLATLRYDAEWHCIRAADVGAPHLRDRIWIVAYPQYSDAHGERSHRAHLYEHGSVELRDEQIRFTRSMGSTLADPQREGRLQSKGSERQERGWSGHGGNSLANPNSSHEHRWCGPLQEGWGWRASQIAADGFTGGIEWRVEPNVGRVAHGISERVDRLCGLGNAVVPQIPEIIGRAIMSGLTSGQASEYQP
jgi:DNA (cytosine-5)-methyltransferase 1